MSLQRINQIIADKLSLVCESFADYLSRWTCA